MEGSHWFACAVNIDCVLRLNVALLVVYSGFDDAITNCLKTITSAWKRATDTLQGMAAHTDACTYLCNYELGIFRTVKKQLFGYVRQRNARVGQADHAHASLYHIVTQSKSGSIIRIIHLKNTKILHCSFCANLMISVWVLSFSKVELNRSSVWLNSARFPVLTATKKIIRKIQSIDKIAAQHGLGFRAHN